MKTVNIQGWDMVPRLTWTSGASNIGCFSKLYYSFILYFDPPKTYNGHLRDWRRPVSGAGYGGYELTEEGKELSKVLSISPMGSETAFGSGIVPAYFRQAGVDPVELAMAAVENSKDKFAQAYGLIVFGDNLKGNLPDNLRGNVGNGGWTSYVAKAIEKLKFGVLTASHAVLNPSHAYQGRLCQAWFWTPPRYAPVTVKAPTSVVEAHCDNEEELLANMHKVWPNQPSQGLTHQYIPHDPDLLVLPKTKPVPQVEVAPPEPTRRVVRARKPKTIAGH